MCIRDRRQGAGQRLPVVRVALADARRCRCTHRFVAAGRDRRDDGRHCIELVQRGDSTALAALDRFCQRLSAFVFNLQVILDVEAFAIGGGISADVYKRQGAN